MIKRILIAVLAVSTLMAIVYALGPRVTFDATLPQSYSELDITLSDLDSVVTSRESAVADIKPGNAARIVWADSIHQKTTYAVVYLHGFSSSHEEGNPIHLDFARRYGANLYLTRLDRHGLQGDDAMKGMTPASYMQSAVDALSIGHALGDSVILISCSTGSTLGIYLAAEARNKIHSHIMYSPNIDLYDPTSELLLYPWADQILRQVIGGEYRRLDYPPIARKYWSSVYHKDGIFTLKHLIDKTMTEEVFSKINHPLFLGYYYLDEDNKDEVVSISEMKAFFDKVSTPDDQKVIMPFGKAGHHVLSSYVMSKDIEGVQAATYKFAEEVLGLAPVTR